MLKQESRTARMVWVGYMVTILLKIVPPKQFTSYLQPFPIERTTGTRQL